MRNSLLYILAIFSLSQAANLVRLADAPALAIGFWRLFISTLVLLPFLIWTSRKNKALNETETTPFLAMSALSALFFFGHLWTFFIAAQKTTIANCMILFSLNPLFIAVIASKFLNVPLPKRLFFAYPLAFAGLLILLWQDLNEHTLQSNQTLGDFSALLSGIFYCGYVLTSREIRKTVSNLKFASTIYAITSFLFLGSCLVFQIPLFNYPSITWIAILGNVFIPTLMGHFLFTYLLRFMNVNLMSCGKLIEPVFSSIVAFFLFQEALKPGIYISFLLTSGSLLILFSNQFKTSK
ncbi:MAG: DMT family transporter [Pseudobdellovibrionaceae bacterium]